MGGAKNCPETPRQKMIGMMYLVLTAMLALNVSADIINGYEKVDDSLHTTIEMVEAKNDFFYRNFKSMMDQNPEKTKEWYDRALLLKERSDSTYNYIQNFKNQLVIMSDGQDKAKNNANSQIGKLGKKDDTNIPHNYGLNQKNGEILKDSIVVYREFLKGLCNNRLDKELDVTFNVDDGTSADGEEIKWEETLFHEMPLCATLTMLSKIQNDIRTEESNVLSWLTNQTDAGDLRVNKLQAYVIPKSDYVIRGSKYSAQIILAAIDSTQNPEYYIEGQRINDNGLYEVIASGSGLKKFKGNISFMNNMGEMESLPFESSYSVGEPSVTISNTELNVMYRDYNNLFAISVPGISNDKIKVSVEGASSSQRNGIWVIRPTEKAQKVIVKVNADIDGKVQNMGSQEYRIEPKPIPGAFFKAKQTEYAGGNISRSAITDPSSTIVASYGPGVLLKLDFTVTKFDIIINGTPYTVSGNHLTQNEIDKIRRLDRGAVISIYNIYAKETGGGSATRLENKFISLTLN